MHAKESKDGRLVKTLNFDETMDIKKIAGADKNRQNNYINGVKFMSKDDKQVSVYDPEDKMRAVAVTVHTLGDNEELIGVYGKKKDNRYLEAFGFIVKVADEE